MVLEIPRGLAQAPIAGAGLPYGNSFHGV